MDHRSNDTCRRTFLAALPGFAALAAFPTRALAQAALTPVRFATIPTQIGGAIYYAKDLGLFEKAGIDAQISALSSGAAVVAAVAGNSLDVGFSNPISLAIAYDKGIPITIIAGAGMADAKKPSNGLLEVLATSSIRTAKDLTGKVIAVSGIGNINHLAVRNWIDLNGGDSKSAKYIELTLNSMAPAIDSGRVDAAVMDVAGIGSTKDRLRTIASTYDSYAPMFQASYWCANTDWVNKNKDLAKKVVAVIKEASIWANGHAREANTLYTHHSKYTLEQLEALPPPIYATSTGPDMLQPCINVAAKYDAIRKAFPAKDLISSVAS